MSFDDWPTWSQGDTLTIEPWMAVIPIDLTDVPPAVPAPITQDLTIAPEPISRVGDEDDDEAGGLGGLYDVTPGPMVLLDALVGSVEAAGGAVVTSDGDLMIVGTDGGDVLIGDGGMSAAVMADLAALIADLPA